MSTEFVPMGVRLGITNHAVKEVYWLDKKHSQKSPHSVFFMKELNYHSYFARISLKFWRNQSILFIYSYKKNVFFGEMYTTFIFLIHLECPPGLFERNCLQNCSENCYLKTCDKKTGACKQGCVVGWKPPLCNKGTYTLFFKKAFYLQFWIANMNYLSIYGRRKGKEMKKITQISWFFFDFNDH